VGNTAYLPTLAAKIQPQRPTTTIITAKIFCENEKAIKLVVVMSGVNLWKPQKLQSRMQFTGLHCKWRFVTIAENKALSASPPRISEFSLLPSTHFPHLSQAFSTGHE
jgi:hypothetical protein